MSVLDKIKVGEELPTYDYRISPGTLLKYYEALGKDTMSDKLRITSETKVPATIFDVSALLSPKYTEMINSVGGAFHSKAHYEFVNPAVVNKKFKIQAKVVDKYEKRNRLHIVIEVVVTDEDSTLILKMKNTFTSFHTVE